jgi:multiple sugar transport system permease protein
MMKSKRKNIEKHKEIVAAFLFLSPALVGFVIFIIGPLFTSFGLSLVKWDIINKMKFVGLSNFKTLFHDSRLLIVYLTTFKFILYVVSLNLIIALVLALGINTKMSKGFRYLFRTVYFFPVITAAASIAIIWQFFLHKDFGPINYYLSKIGIQRISWLGSSQWALISVSFVYVWKHVGFNMILFLAGLQNIPSQLYEVASIDGAGPFRKFISITLPMLSPTLFFALVMAFINGFQAFDLPYILTGGGPGDASRVIVMYLYENGFRFMRMGYASTISLSLFLFILALTLIQMQLRKKWVFYG